MLGRLKAVAGSVGVAGMVYELPAYSSELPFPASLPHADEGEFEPDPREVYAAVSPGNLKCALLGCDKLV